LKKGKVVSNETNSQTLEGKRKKGKRGDTAWGLRHLGKRRIGRGRLLIGMHVKEKFRGGGRGIP